MQIEQKTRAGHVAAHTPAPPAPRPSRPQAVADRPWERLRRELAAALAPELPPLADEVIAAIGEAVPEYRRPLEGAFGQGLRAGVRRSLQQFVDLIGRSGGVSVSSREVYRELGRGEQRAGRTLDALQAAYRLGARLSWRRLSDVARARGADAETVSLLAESIFAYVEEVSASSIEGYAQAQAEVASERERRLRRLVAILVQHQPDDADIDLYTLATEAGWRLPRRVAVLACEHPDVTRLSAMIGEGAIGARLEDVTCVLVPGAGERRVAEVERAVMRLEKRDVWRAAMGPFATVGEAPIGFARASSTLALQQAGVLSASRLALASQHLLTLLLHQDPSLISELGARCLEPLREAPPRSRERLERTLLAWLRHRGSVPATAAELHVHTQTVRYRLRSLRELLGDALEDPDRRLELELALRTRQHGD